MTEYDIPSPLRQEAKTAAAAGEGGRARGSERELVSTPISQRDTPETTFEVYRKTLKIKRPFSGEVPTPPNRTGSQLSGFSDKSRSRLRFTAANGAEQLTSQFCCTYHNFWPVDGRQFKRHVSAFLAALRRSFPFLEYLWIAEFQTRGAPHIHFYSNIPVDSVNKRLLAEAWTRIADPGNADMLRVHLDRKNFIEWDMGSGSYLCKYLDKQHQKAIPDGFRNFGRWWGNSQTLIEDPDRITAANLTDEFPQVNEETGEEHETNALAFLVRTVGRYHEKQNRRSWFRKTNRSTSALTGAPIFRQTLEYLRRSRGTPPPELPPF